MIAFLSTQLTIIQDLTTDKSPFTGKIGFFGMYFNNEVPFFNPFVLKTELGLDFFP